MQHCSISLKTTLLARNFIRGLALHPFEQYDLTKRT